MLYEKSDFPLFNKLKKHKTKTRVWAISMCSDGRMECRVSQDRMGLVAAPSSAVPLQLPTVPLLGHPLHSHKVGQEKDQKRDHRCLVQGVCVCV